MYTSINDWVKMGYMTHYMDILFVESKWNGNYYTILQHVYELSLPHPFHKTIASEFTMTSLEINKQMPPI